MLDIDILGNIYFYEPDLNNRLVSKIWNMAYHRPAVRKWVITWNSYENDMDYINDNILPINKWIKNYNYDSSTEILHPTGVRQLFDITSRYSKFVELYHELRDIIGLERIIGRVDMEYICYLCGKRGHIDVLKFLIESGERVSYTDVLEGAIRNQTYEIFEMLNSTDVAHIALNEYVTIETYGNNRINRFISKLNVKRVINFSEILYPRYYNLNSEMYLKGLVKLGFNTMKKLNFRYIWQKSFTYSKRCIKLMLKYGIYDDGVLTEIMASYLRYSDTCSFYMLDKLAFFTDIRSKNIIQFCIRHNIQLNILSFKWIYAHYELDQIALSSIVLTPQIRNLQVLLNCYRMLSNYNASRINTYMRNNSPEAEI